MTGLTRDECEQWLAAHYGSGSIEEALARRFPSRRTFGVPVDVGQRTAIARSLVQAVTPVGGAVLWITAWGIFPSAENVPLFDGYRRGLDESRTLADAPGHAFDETELAEAQSILSLALYFFWDATLFGSSSAARISHDEWLELHASDDAELQELERQLALA